ncbi:hypothetical protein JCM15519_17820 [Fundidesulfovibrio butyratiphilus]
MGTKIKTIVFLFYQPTTDRLLLRFGIEPLSQHFNIIILDLSQALGNAATPDYQPQSDNITIIPVQTVEEGCELLARFNHTAITIVSTFLGARTKQLYKAIRDNNLRYATLHQGSHHIPTSLPLRYRLLRIKDWTAQTVLKTLCDRIALYNFHMPPPTFKLWIGGSHLHDELVSTSSPEQIVDCHAQDYDRYLALRDFHPEPQNTAVFLDEFMSFSSDYKLSGAKPFSPPDEYYPPLCAYFDSLESKHKGFKVVIAAHPGSDIDLTRQLFQGRDVVKHQSASLVQSCRFVMLHFSTSINFPVLFRKPMQFLTVDSLNRTRAGFWIEHLASQFNTKPLNLSKDFKGVDIPSVVDETLYASFQDKFIKRYESEDDFSWNIIADKFLRFQ